MTLRYWLSGPRILRGLVRPGISFGAKDLAGVMASKPRTSDISMIFIVTRSDGAVTIGRDKTASTDALALSDDDKMPMVFLFRAPGAAEAVLAGTVRRLAKERMDAEKRWYLDLSAGQAAAAIKAEARGLSYDFDVVHPHIEASQDSTSASRHGWAWRISVVILYAVIISFGALIGLVVVLIFKAA